MKDLFRSVMFGGRDLLMQADGGAGAGGHSGGNDNGGQGGDDNGDSGDGGAGGDDSDDGDSDGDGKGEGEAEVDPLDLPQFSKRQVAQMMSSRVNEVKKQFANHGELEDVAKMIGEIIGAPDFNTIVTNIRGLHAQHRQKTGQPPVAPTYQAPNQADTKRQATAAQFDNDFVKKAEFADASLFRDEIIDFAMNGFTLEQAYWAVAGPLVSNKKAENAARNAAQVAANKAKQNKHKQVTPGETGNPGKSGKPVIPAHIKANAEKIGMDPEEYMAWAGVSTLDQANALRGRK